MRFPERVNALQGTMITPVVGEKEQDPSRVITYTSLFLPICSIKGCNEISSSRAEYTIMV